MILDDDVLRQLQAIRDHALNHPVSPTQLLGGRDIPVQEQSMHIAPGYFVFFTVERFPDGRYYGQLSVGAVERRQPDATIEQMEVLAILLGLGERQRWTVCLEPARSGLRAFNVFGQVN